MAVSKCSVCAASYEVPPDICDRCKQPFVMAFSLPTEAPVDRDAMVVLCFPWGEMGLADGENLNLGRDPGFSPLADNLAPYEYVSRQHATIAVSDGKVYLLDKRSRHGTTINQEVASPGTAAVVADGSVVELAEEIGFTVAVRQRED